MAATIKQGMVKQVAELVGIPPRVLQAAVRFGAVKAQQVSGFFWLVEVDSARRFATKWKAEKHPSRENGKASARKARRSTRTKRS